MNRIEGHRKEEGKIVRKIIIMSNDVRSSCLIRFIATAPTVL